MRVLQPDSARSRPIPPDSARSRPIPPDSSPHPSGTVSGQGCSQTRAADRSRPILARTLRNGVWTGVLANEACSPIPPDPARSRPIPPDSGTTKMVMRTPETKKKICQQHPCWQFFFKNGHAHPPNKKNLPAAPLLVNFLREVVPSALLGVLLFWGWPGWSLSTQPTF